MERLKQITINREFMEKLKRFFEKWVERKKFNVEWLSQMFQETFLFLKGREV